MRKASVKGVKMVWWGTYDLGKPRTRILLRGLKENGAEITECHKNLWAGVEDKSQVMGVLNILRFGLNALTAYTILIYRYLRLPRPDVVFIGYMGQFDILILYPFFKLRKTPVVLDAFLSLYDTIVNDRKLVSPGNPLARLLYFVERLSYRAADMVLLDTAAHAEYVQQLFKIEPRKMASVFVGTEPEKFTPQEEPNRKFTENLKVLFYGQCIPLHGVSTILKAVELARDKQIEWHIVGSGQEENLIKEFVEKNPDSKLNWERWVPYERLSEIIHEADICLGIFGDSEKAARVIPNKVFQIVASGRPLVTRNSSAITELLFSSMPGVYLVPPSDPSALLDALLKFFPERQKLTTTKLHTDVHQRIFPAEIGRDLLEKIGKRLSELG